MPRRQKNVRKSGKVQWSRKVFATVGAGSTSTCTLNSVFSSKDRSARLTRIEYSVQCVRGTMGLIEIVMFNQGQTQVASTGVLHVRPNGVYGTLRPSGSADMWFDAGNLLSSTIKLAHFDFPCVTKLMENFSLNLIATLHFELGPELVSDICPNFSNVLESSPRVGNHVSPACRQLSEGDMEELFYE